MLIHPEINPVALQLGPLAIHWYGLTYLAAFGLFFFLASLRLRHEPFASITGPGAWSRRDIEDILFLGVMGVVIGGRLGYCLFYKPGYYASTAQFCHTSLGIFPHINPGELFTRMGIASGIMALGLNEGELAVRYLRVGAVLNFLGGWVTDFTTAYVSKQQGITLAKEVHANV